MSNFVSNLDGIPIVTKTNYRDFAHRVNKDGVSESGFRARPLWAPKPLCARMGLPKELYIDRKVRREMIEEQERKGTRLLDVMKRHKIWIHQANSNQCWSFAVAQSVMARMLTMGLPPVSLCPTFAACIVNNYRDTGGWGDWALDCAAKYGIPTIQEMPLNKFSQANVEKAKPKAALRKVTEWDLFPGDWDARASMVLRGFGCFSGYNKISHETMSCAVALDSRGGEIIIDHDNYTPDGGVDLQARTEGFGAGEDQGCPRTIDVAA